MKYSQLLRAASVVLFTASLEAADWADLRQILSRPRAFPEQRAASASRHAAAGRATLVTDGDTVLPFIVNRNGIVSKIRLINMETREVNTELFLVDDEGFDREIEFRGRGKVASVRAALPPLGALTLETTGTGDAVLAWGFLDAGNNAVAISVSLELASDAGTYAVGYPAQYVNDKRVRVSYDNTGGVSTEINVINLNFEPVQANVVVRGEDGASQYSGTERIPDSGAIGFAPAEVARQAQNARGTVEFTIPATTRFGIAAVAVQFFERGGVNILTGFSTLE